MSDLIRRDSIITELKLDSQLSQIGNTYAWMYIDMAIDRIKKAPAVDAVEVVRCGECYHYEKRTPLGLCNHYLVYKPSCGFCDLGERRENG